MLEKLFAYFRTQKNIIFVIKNNSLKEIFIFLYYQLRRRL